MRDMQFIPTTACGCQPNMEQATQEAASLVESQQAKNWLENTIPMDVLTGDSSDPRDATNALFDELLGIVFVSNSERCRESLKTVLLNLELDRRLNVPVRYARNKNWYSHDARYGRLHFKYDRLIPIIVGLEVLV